MTTEHPEGPETPLVPDASSLIMRYLPELEGTPTIDRVGAYFSVVMFALFVGLGGFNLFGLVGGVVTAVALVVLGVGAFEGYRRRVLAESGGARKTPAVGAAWQSRRPLPA